MADDEIELPLDPEDGLSAELLTSLTRFVLVSEQAEAWARLDGLWLLMQEWDDFSSDFDRIRWIADRGDVALRLTRTDRGELERAPVGEGTETIPVDLVRQLAAAAVIAESPDRTIARESIRDLLASWAPFFDDHEKLLGHLLLSHGESHELVGRSHDELLELHTLAHSS